MLKTKKFPYHTYMSTSLLRFTWLTCLINVRCVASTHVTSFLSVQVHGESHALTCRPAGFHSEAAGAIERSRRGQIYLSP